MAVKKTRKMKLASLETKEAQLEVLERKEIELEMAVDEFFACNFRSGINDDVDIFGDESFLPEQEFEEDDELFFDDLCEDSFGLMFDDMFV